jgi:hypothetical protein
LRQVLWPLFGEGETRTEVARRLGIKTTALPLLVEYFRREVRELSR